MSENDLYEALARYVRLSHPDALFHFDLSGMWTPSHKARNLYGRLNARSWPDFQLCAPAMMPGTTNIYYGLFLELKKDGTRLRKRNGEWASEHLAEQAMMLSRLHDAGYCAVFAVGLDEAIAAVDSYMAGALVQPRLQHEESATIF